MSGTVLNYASIIIVALVTAADSLSSFFAFDSPLERILLGALSLSLTALFVDLLLALISQLQLPYTALRDPTKILETLDNGNLFTDMETARHYYDGTDGIYQGLSRRNYIMRGLLNAASIAIFVAFVAILLGAVLLLPCACGMLG